MNSGKRGILSLYINSQMFNCSQSLARNGLSKAQQCLRVVDVENAGIIRNVDRFTVYPLTGS
jgi:sulfur relay (sulfurtransferase) DsrF/TusC family protein